MTPGPDHEPRSGDGPPDRPPGPHPAAAVRPEAGEWHTDHGPGSGPGRFTQFTGLYTRI